ncbi:hypothetical protein [Cryptosporangium sp. NPDC051539]
MGLDRLLGDDQGLGDLVTTQDAEQPTDLVEGFPGGPADRGDVRGGLR